jgi:eight-cysteine-cluster-containing protein
MRGIGGRGRLCYVHALLTWSRPVFLALLLACAGTRAVDVPPAPASPERAAVSADVEPGATLPVADGGPVDVPVTDPAALYVQCRERVEGVSVPGECVSDADCARAGCSSEVCVAAARKAEAVTTCEILPCFDVLASCGCVDGQCSWTVGPPAARTRVQLPPK